jgi:hypothetical protein
MRATDGIRIAVSVAMAQQRSIHQKWISAQHRPGILSGSASLYGILRISSIDIILRQLEDEHLNESEPVGIDVAFDAMCSLAHYWVLQTYEVIRSAYQLGDGEIQTRLKDIKRRLELVRMPIAKGEIRHAQKKKTEAREIVLVKEDGSNPKPYADGYYMVPQGICGATGSVMWWVIDLESRKTVEICRRDLSDEFLALFD